MVKVAINQIDGTYNLSKTAYTWLIRNRGWHHSGYLPTQEAVDEEIAYRSSLMEPTPVDITITRNGDGVITTSPATPMIGDDVSVIITPATGYYTSSVIVNGDERGSVSVVTFPGVMVNQTVIVTFSPVPETPSPAIITSRTAGGAITNPGTNYIEEGSHYIVAMRPDALYKIDFITVDNTPIVNPILAPDGSYTITWPSVTETHSVFVAFTHITPPEEYTLALKIIYEDKYGNWISNITDRTDSDVIAAIEALGSIKSSGPYAKLKIVSVPDTISDWTVRRNCNGGEVVAESFAIFQ